MKEGGKYFISGIFNGIFIVSILLSLAAVADPLNDTRPNVDAIAEVAAGTRDTVNAAWWGFDPVDATACLQSAIDSGAKKVVVPFMDRPWIIRPVNLRSRLELVFEPGVLVLAKEGEFKGGGDSLFTAADATDLTIRGYGATLRMRKQDYQSKAYEKAEWRMTIDISGCRRVCIEGLTIEKSGGDGIYIGATKALPRCEDVVIRDVRCRNHHRQGISVISAKNLLIENCALDGTDGTAPEAGIDLEPNQEYECLTNVVLRNCTMQGNSGAGILIYLKQFDHTTEPISVRVENCHVKNGKDQAVGIGALGDDGPTGSIEFKDCTFENTRNGGLYIYDKAAKAASIRFENCKWRHVATRGTEKEPGTPFLFHQRMASISKGIGGVEWIDCILYDDRDRPCIEVEGVKGQPEVTDIRGQLRRIGPGKARVSPETALPELALIGE